MKARKLKVMARDLSRQEFAEWVKYVRTSGSKKMKRRAKSIARYRRGREKTLARHYWHARLLMEWVEECKPRNEEEEAGLLGYREKLGGMISRYERRKRGERRLQEVQRKTKAIKRRTAEIHRLGNAPSWSTPGWGEDMVGLVKDLMLVTEELSL